MGKEGRSATYINVPLLKDSGWCEPRRTSIVRERERMAVYVAVGGGRRKERRGEMEERDVHLPNK